PLEEWLAPLVTVVTRPQLPPAMLALVVETEVDQDPVEPGRELRPAAEAPGRLEEADERLLRDVPGVLAVAQDGPGEAVRPLLVARHEEVERRLVPPGHALAERLVRWLHSAVVLSAPTSSLPAPGPQAPLLSHVAGELALILPQLAPVVPAIANVLAQLAPGAAQLRAILSDLVGAA